MKVGVVSGSVWATKKSPVLTGQSLLRVQMENRELVAADLVGAGVQDRVIVAFGSAAKAACDGLPIDAAIIGILDETEEYPHVR